MLQLRTASDRVHSWLAVLSIAMGAFVVITSEFLPIGLLGSISADNHVSVGTGGTMIALPGLVAAVAAPAATVFAGNRNRKALLIGFAALVMVSDAIVALSPHFAGILLARLLLGIGVGGFWTFAVAAGRRLVPERSGSRATALILSGVSVGTVVGVPAGTALGAMRGWRFAFASVGAVAALIVLAQMSVLPDLPGREPVSLPSLLGLFRIRALRVGFLASALTAAGHFAAYTYLQPFLSEVLHLRSAGIAWALVVNGVAGIAGTFLAEHAASHGLRQTFFGVSLVLGLAILTAAVCNGDAIAGVGAVVFWGAAFGALPVCTQLWTFHAAPSQFEPASATGMTVFQIALVAGAFGGGRLFDSAGLTSAFMLGALFSLSCAAVLFFASRDLDVARTQNVRGRLKSRSSS